MATIDAIQSGPHNDPATWDGGVVPGPGDTARPNGFIVTVASAWEVEILTNDAAGGYFELLDGAEVSMQEVQPATPWVIQMNDAGTATLIGGTLIGGASGQVGPAYVNHPDATLLADTAFSMPGASLAARVPFRVDSGKIVLVRSISTAYDRPFYLRNPGSTAEILGDILAVSASGSLVHGDSSDDSLLILHGKVQLASDDSGPVHTNPNARVWLMAGAELIPSPGGIVPVLAGRVFMDQSGPVSWTFRTEDLEAERTLYTADQVGDQPDEADTRHGVEYADGALVGSCRMPPKKAVAIGVPVDDGVGEMPVSSVRAEGIFR